MSKGFNKAFKPGKPIMESCLPYSLSIVLLFCFFLTFTQAFAGEPLSEPQLRLGTKMHAARVSKISPDAAGRFALTCSTDKTAKLWDVKNGSLLKTFRVPIGKGNEGNLYSCALSPDGRTAAVGGWTKAGHKGHNIYLFNTATGDMTQRLSGMENVIHDLEFYSNTIFAAALGGGHGIRILKKSGPKFTLYKKDTDYGTGSYNLTFDSNGRLASMCDDGFIRLYDTDFNRIKKVKAIGGKKPYPIAFSPDNEKLAVGYRDTETVEVFNAESLAFLYHPDIKDVGGGKGFLSLSFGPGGSLYGGGKYQKYVDGYWRYFIRRWSKDGVSFTEFKASGNLILDIKPLADGSILVAGSQPDIGRFTSTGEKFFYNQGEVTDFRNNQFKYFTVNPDASEISCKPRDGTPFTFSIKNRELKQSSLLLKKYRDHFGTIQVTDWKNTYSPKINGKSTDFLRQNEISRSVDIGEDKTILVGADWSVYALDVSGKKKWKAAVPGVAWSVNIAKDGRTAVAAHSGGQIRWYRMSDGAVLLSLFVHPDGKRWILWTPDGYYDASIGADTLMGWHINNGRDTAAGFYPVSKFKSKFYRPDVVGNVLKYNDTGKALAAANKTRKKKPVTLDIKQMLPPMISILSPQTNDAFSSGTVRVRYQVQTPSGETVTNIKVLIDGRPTGQRGVQRIKAEGIAEMILTVPPKDSTITLIAENRFSTSDPATVKLFWKGDETFIIKPKLYVLAMGTSAYENKELRLGYPAKDARDVAAVFKNQKGGIYRDVVTKVLSDPTRNDVMDGLEWIEKETTDLDVAAVFLAGHGVNDRNGNYYYLPANVDLDHLKRSGVSYATIKETITGLPGKVLFFIDTCHSGNVMGSKRRGAPADINQMANDLSSADNGVVVFTSSSGKQYSLENDAWQNGAFTKALVEGLSGKADYHQDNKISVSELTLYVTERVKELTSGTQTPTTSKPDTISDFPVAVKN